MPDNPSNFLPAAILQLNRKKSFLPYTLYPDRELRLDVPCSFLGGVRDPVKRGYIQFHDAAQGEGMSMKVDDIWTLGFVYIMF